MSLYPISTINLDGVSSVTISNINPNLKCLYVNISARSTAARYDAYVGLRFNGDTGNNYFYMNNSLNKAQTSGSFSTAEVTSANKIGDFPISGNSGGIANAFSQNHIWIYGFGDSSRTTTCLTYGGHDQRSVGMINSNSGSWNNTAQVTSITFFEINTNTFMSGSIIRLFGWEK